MKHFLTASTAWLQAPLPKQTSQFLSVYLLASFVVFLSLVIFLKGYFDVHFLSELYWFWLPAFALLTVSSLFLQFQNQPLNLGQVTLALLIAILLMGGLLYHTGGIINPFIFLLLTPILLAASILTWQPILLLSLVTSLLFLFLTQFYVPIMSLKFETLDNLFNWYLFGALFSFLLLMIFITAIVFPLKHQLDQQEKKLNTLENQALRNETLMTTNIFAAATAHKISTPLNSVFLIQEMLKPKLSQADPQTQADFDLMSDQLQVCQSALNELKNRIQASGTTTNHWQHLESWLSDFFEELQLRHPSHVILKPIAPPLEIQVEYDFNMALLNLIDNALRASPNQVELKLQWEKGLQFIVNDHGSGIPSETLQQLGESPILDASGLGMGLFLSQNIIQRYQGSLAASNTMNGTQVIMTLPEDRLKEFNRADP